MKTILHIGTGKTGTTSIQGVLHNSREILKKKKFLFTKTLGFTNNIDIAMYGIKDIEDIKASNYLSRNNIHSEKDKKAFDLSVEDKFKSELINSGASCDSLIVSSEHFSTVLRKQEHVNSIAYLFSKLNLDVNVIIIYLRSQISYIYSDFNTRVLMGLKTNKYPHIPKKLGILPINYEQTLKIWANSFPNSKIVVKIFEKNDLFSNDVVLDFFSLLGIDYSTLKTGILKVNKSLPSIALKFLIEWNNYVLDNNKIHLSIKHEKIRNMLIPIIKCFFNGTTLKPTFEEYLFIKELCEKSNEWVRINYRPDRDVLFESNDLSFRDASEDLLWSSERLRDLVLHLVPLVEKSL